MVEVEFRHILGTLFQELFGISTQRPSVTLEKMFCVIGITVVIQRLPISLFPPGSQSQPSVCEETGMLGLYEIIPYYNRITLRRVCVPYYSGSSVDYNYYRYMVYDTYHLSHSKLAFGFGLVPSWDRAASLVLSKFHLAFGFESELELVECFFKYNA
ncbi:hypothetical protein K435DRAFT_803366 [Dendrothele bispora CBS 962.96]|uniref:Uncharacterized protein n=1 Tax=Dendrothele bispora (strain CBS 962.96) TaxID=1314807 RepID=A0A4S8LHX9_DENBC|nr:hypothetical protein K435DRAFT_803366 [Dendrothele bispora CBS 962.96]